MGLPVIPDRTQEQAITDLLESIALEETALAALVHAEAEKIQDLAENQVNADDTIAIQETVRRILAGVIKKEMLLQFKLEEILRFKREEE